MDEPPTTTVKRHRRYLLLFANALLLTVGTCGGPLVKRLYFLRGGKRIWFSSWLESAGCPIILIPLLLNYTRRRRQTTTRRSKLILMELRVFLPSAAIGLLTGLDDYLYAYGVAKLPVSTSSLILATQTAFTAGFAYLVVKQRLTAYSINAVVVLTVAAAILGIHSGGGDKPAGESNWEYLLGFLMTLAAAALYGLLLPTVELVYMKAKQAVTYTLVMEIQLVMCFFATVFCTVGMIVNKDFQAISREAKEFELGEKKYYLVVIANAMMWQCFFLGINGVIFYSSSLLSGIIMSMLLPVTELLAVLFFHERFQPEKGISLFLSFWGFVSYFYGDIRDCIKLKNKNKEEDIIETGDECRTCCNNNNKQIITVNGVTLA